MTTDTTTTQLAEALRALLAAPAIASCGRTLCEQGDAALAAYDAEQRAEATPVVLGDKLAPHLYRLGVEPAGTVIDVHARTRWAATTLAEKFGYTVRDCNMLG